MLSKLAMWFAKIFTTVLVALTGLLPSSCSTVKKSSAQQPASAVADVSGSSTNKNLGELSLTNHYETCVNLGAGKSCTIRPTRLDRSNLQLTMSVESKGANGKLKDLSVVQVVTKSGKSFEVAVGDVNLTLTPKLTEE
jgi:hypothetical protein